MEPATAGASMSGDAPPLRVVQVAKYAQGGGAERVAASLHEGLRRRGHRSWLATARASDDPSMLMIPPPPNEPTSPVSRALLRAAEGLGSGGGRGVVVRTVRRGLRFAAAPRKALDKRHGRESFDYPGTAAIPDLPPEPPDLIHCHNLHGNYFDLRQLAPMSRRLPLVMTLHDEWTFTGHCAYALYGDRWRTGCVSCPDLAIYPAIPRDGTQANLRAKRQIYRRSRLYITTPSRWLLDRAQDSVIAEGAAAWKLIPNGVDRSRFTPGDAAAARARLDLPREPFILLFAANGVRRSPFKDFPTVSRAVVEAASRVSTRPLLCLALGDTGPPESFPNGELRFVPYRSDLNDIAAYYQAADVYLHAAKAENLPTTILEALATGLPVVATAVGGIPEEVRSLAGAPGAWAGAAHPRQEATGVLVAPGDATGMGAAAAGILGDDGLRATLSANAVRDAAARFDLEQQLDSTIGWYREIIADWRLRARTT
jgi:glycosyltransferase involved in cell wall biosynthesis